MIDFEKLQLRQFEDTYTLSRLEQIFKHKRGWVSRMPPKNCSVILVLSGGIDSICLWNILMEKYSLRVYPIYFIDPKIQGKNKELQSICYFSKVFKKKYPTLFRNVFIKDYSYSFSFSSLKKYNNIKIDLPTIFSNLLFLSDQKTHIPSLIDTPSRLGIYSFGALEYGHLLRALENVDVNTLFVGLIPEDGMSVRESTHSVLKSINLSLCLILGDFNWQVLAPIDKNARFYLSKKDLVDSALKNKLPIDKTWSCRAYNKYHCGRCFNCISRKEVFRLLHFKDSTVYTPSQSSNKSIFIEGLKYMKNSVHALPKRTSINETQIPPDILLSSIVTPAQDASWHELKKKVFIMNQSTSNIERLNPVGAFIWKEIVLKPYTLSRLINKITTNYMVNRLQATKDLKLLLTEMEKKGYIKVTNRPLLLKKK